MIDHSWAPDVLRCIVKRHQNLMWGGKVTEFRSNFDRRYREYEAAYKISNLALRHQLYEFTHHENYDK